MDEALLYKAYHEWNSFLDSLGDDEKKELANISGLLDANNLHYYAATKDDTRFYQTINRLSKKQLYSDELIPTIYQFYVDRELHVLAFDYLNKSAEYQMNITGTISGTIQNHQSVNFKLLQQIKLSIGYILSLEHENIPHVVPEKHNDKNRLNDFILHEFVLASKIMLEKIHGIKTITHEDRFSDLLLAILRLRFSIWGWSIHDQARTGNSSTGINAGETDITIQSASITIGLVEALVLEGRETANTQAHVHKMFLYTSQLERYYVIIYYKGSEANYENTWVNYKTDVLAITFPTNFTIKPGTDFQDLSDQFVDVNNLKIAKTHHGRNVELFHLMIKLV